MLVIDAPRAAVVSTTEVKNDVRGAFKTAEEYRVYVTKDGQPIGGIISMAMMGILEDALENLQIAGIATDRPPRRGRLLCAGGRRHGGARQEVAAVPRRRSS
jgi:hypothetical protein